MKEIIMKWMCLKIYCHIKENTEMSIKHDVIYYHLCIHEIDICYNQRRLQFEIHEIITRVII